MSQLTNVPVLDDVIVALPAAEGILTAVGLPEIAVFVAALDATLKVAQSAIEGKGFDAASALKAEEATALAELKARFHK